MDAKNFSDEQAKIFSDYYAFKTETEEKLSNLLSLACKEFGDYLVKSKGFIHYEEVIKPRNFKLGILNPDGSVFDQESDEEFEEEQKKVYPNREYYYDTKTHIGIMYEVPDYIDLTAEYNSIPLSIVYKAQNKFLSHHKQVYYFYKKETPEKVFIRFKKFLGKAESTRMKEYLKMNYSKEILAGERALKIKNINKI